MKDYQVVQKVPSLWSPSERLKMTSNKISFRQLSFRTKQWHRKSHHAGKVSINQSRGRWEL